VGAIDVRFGQVQLAALSQIMSEAEQRAVKHAILDPLLKPPVTRLVGRIASRHIGPGRSGSQDPENAVDHVAWIAPRAMVIHAVREWRAAGLQCYFTIDAGSNVHVICAAPDRAELERRLAALPGVQFVLGNGVGMGARVKE